MLLMLYVYAITRADPEWLPRGDGARVDARPLFAVKHGRVAAVCAARDEFDPSPTPTAEQVLCHERVVEDLMRAGPVLPARFGSLFASEATLEDVLQPSEMALVEALDRVDGCVELSLHAIGPPRNDAPAPMTTGRAYMTARLKSERTRREASERLHAAVAPLAIDSVRRAHDASDLLFSAAYLVRRDRVEAFRRRASDAAAAARDARHHLRVLCTGPWPPYHFVPRLDVAAPQPEVAHAR